MPQYRPPMINPGVGASDRLGFTLFLALTIHAIVVLGVGFTYSKISKSGVLPNLDIILANSQSLEAVENPDFLAQVDQAGGGKAEEKARPSAPVSSNTPLDQLGLSDQARTELRRNQLEIDRLYFITQDEFQHQVVKYTQDRKQQSTSQQAGDVDQRQTQIARLQAEIRQMTINYAKRPKSIVLTASTKKAIEASYLASWVQKIEHTGNLNYPQEAVIKNINGRLRLSVRINAAGEILDVKITRSSGSTVLDEAAKRILRLAEPFVPFSEELKQRADQIVIIRTWEFNSNRLHTKGEV
ncbi:MAG: energy transducer TonB [Gammaproteobacteria bacterium]|nr:energy transducer TonB [Gammaproteobacteria bacterium]